MIDTTSRRALVVGLATLPAIGTVNAAAPTALRSDPIFEVLERHRRATAAIATIDEVSERAQFEAAGDELHAADEALFATKPVTVLGCLAFIEFILADAEDAANEWSCRG